MCRSLPYSIASPAGGLAAASGPSGHGRGPGQTQSLGVHACASQDEPTEADTAQDEPTEADTATKSTEDLLPDIKRLSEQTRFRTVEELLENQGSLLDVAQQVLATNPDVAVRDQAREAVLTAAYGITRYDATRKDLLESVDTLATDILAETTEGEMAASAMFYKTMVHLNLEREDSAEDPDRKSTRLKSSRW